MNTFLTKDDYKGIITSDELEVITTDNEGELTNEQVRKKTENLAISKITKLIGERHDTNVIFSSTEQDRDDTIIEYTIYYTLYILHGSIAKKNVPEDRYEQYREARDFFKEVFEGNKTIPGLPLLSEGDNNLNEVYRFGGEESYPTGY